jgi:hypothetical protein
MLQVNKLKRHHYRADTTLEQSRGTRSFDWAVLVVALAVGSTLLWIGLLFWVASRVLRVALP